MPPEIENYASLDRRKLTSRVDLLENNLMHLKEEHKTHKEKEEEYMQQQTKLIQEIRDEQTKMKGFWGGVVFVCSAISVAVGIFFSHFTAGSS